MIILASSTSHNFRDEMIKLDTGYERGWLMVNHSTNLRDYCNFIYAIAESGFMSN